MEPEKPFPAVERALAGRLLAKLGDPRPGVGLISPPGRDVGLPDITWCDVSAGTFLMGSDKKLDRFARDSEMPQHEVTIAAFKMSRYPITNAQYQAFVDDGGKEPRKLREPFGLSNHPVVGVTWYDAMAFCDWLTKRLLDTGELKEGMVVRLPSEAEWEYAARGPDGLIYPWGNEPEPKPELANYDETNFGETSAVGCFPRGKSLFSGCEEIAGNVWEWCLDVWHDTHDGAPTDGSVREEGKDINLRLLKGGSWYYPSRRLRSAYRDWLRRDL
ncbi:MAG: formylglycine-generating enzyme family protein, partial [Gammaproteobacteria bacterium]|nr:formylglycine-generating enzyme family protein [Gammaproteobacteria bacterium]